MRVWTLAAALVLALTACAGQATPTRMPLPTASPPEAGPIVLPSATSATAAPVIVTRPAKLRFVEFFAGS